DALILEIWSELLGNGSHGLNDNFFEVGGHSLLAVRLMSRVRDVFQIDLPLQSIFEFPTISGLTIEVNRALGILGPPSKVLPLQRAARLVSLPLSFAQQRLWLIDQMDPGSAGYNIPMAAVISGKLSIGALENSLNELTRRHESLRTTFREERGTPV